MSTPYVGEIRMFAGNFAPLGWSFCDGKLVSIAENEVLFALLGTTYGGDGESTFALPDLRGRLAVAPGSDPQGQSYILGEVGGTETVMLRTAQLPTHRHPLTAVGQLGNEVSPQNHLLARSNLLDAYTNRPADGQLADVVGSIGGGQPHDNMQPYLCIAFIISLFGVFPTPT